MQALDFAAEALLVPIIGRRRRFGTACDRGAIHTPFRKRCGASLPTALQIRHRYAMSFSKMPNDLNPRAAHENFMDCAGRTEWRRRFRMTDGVQWSVRTQEKRRLPKAFGITTAFSPPAERERVTRSQPMIGTRRRNP